MISLGKVSCLLASRTLGSSFSWNSKGTVSQGPCRSSIYLTIVMEDIPDHLLVLCDQALQTDDVFTWQKSWKTFLTNFLSCVIQHSRLMTILPDNSRGRHSWPSSHPRWADTPDWWSIYLTIVVEDIHNPLLVLGEPTLQADGVFTWQ